MGWQDDFPSDREKESEFMLELGIIVVVLVLTLYGGERLVLWWERWRVTRATVKRLRRHLKGDWKR